MGENVVAYDAWYTCFMLFFSSKNNKLYISFTVSTCLGGGGGGEAQPSEGEVEGSGGKLPLRSPPLPP